MPLLGTTDISCYGKDWINTILKHYGKDLTAESMLAEKSVKPTLVSSDITFGMENVSQIHCSTAQGRHEGITDGINHEQHAHSKVP